MERTLAELEAILYAAGRPLTLTTLCEYLRLNSEGDVAELVGRLAESYEKHNSPLEVRLLPGGRVVLQLRVEYSKVAKSFSPKPLLTRGPLRTLSFIALYQPIEQRRVAEARGSHAYRHLRRLEEMGLITREKRGRKTIVRTTPDFADYLGLSRDSRRMKRQLRRLFKRLELREVEERRR
jgi:segregation and condensation protein B